MLITWI